MSDPTQLLPTEPTLAPASGSASTCCENCASWAPASKSTRTKRPMHGICALSRMRTHRASSCPEFATMRCRECGATTHLAADCDAEAFVRILMTIRQRNLEMYRRLKFGTRTPTGQEHAWGREFVTGYPDTCPHCGCQTKGPFDDSRISHDVDACTQNHKLTDATKGDSNG